MHNIIRDNYTPKTGDYHNTIVHDTARNHVWLFDCDGTYLDLTKTDVTVVNEAGDSEVFAISQQFVTREIARLDALAATIDTESQDRDRELVNSIYQAKTELNAAIAKVNTDAIQRETDIRNALEAHCKALDNSVDNLTRVTNLLTTQVNTINQTAVFDVTLYQDTNISLRVVDGATTETYVFRDASATQRGLMTAETYNQVNQNTDAIKRLQNAGLYRGSFDTLADAPTRTPDTEFIHGEIYNNDFITVQKAEHEGETGIAHYRAMVEDGKVTYYFESFVDKDILNFATDQPGLIVGSEEEGYVSSDAGRGKVNGFAEARSDIDNNAANITTLEGRATSLEGRADQTDTTLADHASQLDALKQADEQFKSQVESLTSEVTAAKDTADTLASKRVKDASEEGYTTLQDTTEPLLTHDAFLASWVDITETGLPESPEADKFYYTVVE